MADYIRANASVLEQVHNQNTYEEAEAAEELYPGEGVTLANDGEGNLTATKEGLDGHTTYVVREQRNPPRGMGDFGDSPIDMAYNEGDHVEVIGFNRYDRARLRVGGDPSPGDEVGWDGDGRVTDANDPEVIGKVHRVIERTELDDLAVVEFY